MRRPLATAVLLLCVLLGMVPARAGGTTTTVEVLAPLQGIALSGVCPFPVELTERTSRTLTTVFDATGTVVRRELSGNVQALLTNVVNGVSLTFDTGGMTIVYRADGTATVTQKSGSGIAYDQGRVSGSPSLVWFSGKVITHGIVDRSFTIDVISQVRQGRASDICEMLVSGLKSRH